MFDHALGGCGVGISTLCLLALPEFWRLNGFQWPFQSGSAKLVVLSARCWRCIREDLNVLEEILVRLALPNYDH